MTKLERVKMDVRNLWWTSINEVIEELEELDYFVIGHDYECIVVEDAQDDDEDCYIFHLGHANRTIWVDNVKEY